MTAIGFEQSKVNPCVSRKIIDGEVEMVVVVHVKDILPHVKDQATMERFAAELGSKFTLKGMGDAKYYIGYHIRRDSKARGLKLDQHLHVKSAVEMFGVEKATRIPVSSRMPTFLFADESKIPEKKET